MRTSLRSYLEISLQSRSFGASMLVLLFLSFVFAIAVNDDEEHLPQPPIVRRAKASGSYCF